MGRLRVSLGVLALVGLLATHMAGAAAQQTPGVGDSGPAVGEFTETDGNCGFPNFTDDTYEATLGEDDQGRFIRLTQKSTGDSGVFRRDADGNITFETEGDESYEQTTIDGEVLRARYVYTSANCPQVWQVSVSFPPGFLAFLLAQAPTAAEEPPEPAPQADATTPVATTPTTANTAVAPPITAQQSIATEEPDAGSSGLPIWAWWVIGLLVVGLILVTLWYSVVATGRGTRAPGDNGDDPRDTTPPAVYGEEFDQFIIKYCFYVAPNLKKAMRPPSRRTVSKRTRARAKHQKLIDRIAQRRRDGQSTRINEKHRPQIGTKGTADRWIDAIYWWQEQINAQCVGRLSIDAVIELKPIETEGLIDDEDKPLDHFAKTAELAKEKASERWVVGQGDLDSRTREGDATRTHFHISLFDYVRVKPNTKTDGIIFGMGSDGKPPPFANFGAVLRKPSERGEVHEVGHLFGLEHGDGGVMDKSGDKYGQGFAFSDATCRKVIRQLKGS